MYDYGLGLTLMFYLLSFLAKCLATRTKWCYGSYNLTQFGYIKTSLLVVHTHNFSYFFSLLSVALLMSGIPSKPSTSKYASIHNLDILPSASNALEWKNSSVVDEGVVRGFSSTISPHKMYLGYVIFGVESSRKNSPTLLV